MTFINKTRTQVLELGLRDGSVPFFCIHCQWLWWSEGPGCFSKFGMVTSQVPQPLLLSSKVKSSQVKSSQVSWGT